MNILSLARSLARSQRSFQLMALFALGFGAIGCVRQPDDEATRKPGSQPIQLGWDDEDTPARNATALIVKTASGGGSCTASLITSLHALTATHCAIQAGDTIIFGAENENVPGQVARARRTITRVEANLPGIGMGHEEVWRRARDVSLVWLDHPITMQASPRKPSFQRPALVSVGGIETGTLSGGISGYGILRKYFINPEGGATFYDEHPAKRQVATSSSFDVMRMETGSGYAVWINKFQKNVSSGEAHGGHGDSGGPLFRRLADEFDARDVLGVFSGWYTETCMGFPKTPFCDPDNGYDYYADITAPAMRSWIEGFLDPNGDGHWAGEVDYTRSTFGTPGCDVNADPGCDPGCNAAKDADCDLVFDDNDSCKHDYNPDQRNSDDPVNIEDRSSHDPGDACDPCVTVLENGDNCNSDAEILKWGERPRLRETDVIGPNPLSPFPQAVVDLVRQRYRGDQCDPSPCTELGAQMVQLDATKFGSPDPTQPPCTLTQQFGGQCAFQAKAQIQRDGRRGDVTLAGHTGYRFCQCDGPFLKQADRIQNCFNDTAGPQCPVKAEDFNKSSKLAPVTIDPSPSPIPGTSPLELGTPDLFTAWRKANPPAFTWLFEQDVNAILGTPNPTLPLTNASAAAIAIDGLLQSNVRETSSAIPTADADLQSHWLPTRLRVEPNVFTGGVTNSAPLPGWWSDPCPTCGFGLSSPWELVTQPVLPPALFGLTVKGPLNITSSVDSAALTLLRSATEVSGRVIVPAAEHRGTLTRLAKPLAPRVAVTSAEDLLFLGAVGQDAEGQLVMVRGLSDAIGIAGMVQSASSKPIVSPKAGSGGAAKATLSAVHESLYVLRKPGGRSLSELHVFDILRNEWTERPLRGAVLPEAPLALTYAAQPDALFALDRSNGANGASGTVRLFRIRLDGQVELLAQGFGIAPSAQVFLTATELGRLVLAVTREHPARCAVLELDAFGATAKATRLYKAGATLRGSPFLTERALHLLVMGSSGGFQALEIDPKKMAPIPPTKWQLPDIDI